MKQIPEPTIAFRIAESCAADDFAGSNGQMCVVSTGFDLEGIASHLFRFALRQMESINACVSFVILPDSTKSGTLARVASALRMSFLSHSSTSPLTEPVRVHLAEEGTSPKARCAFYQSGGVVVLSCRTLCADMLRRRVAHALVGAAVVLLPHGCCCCGGGDATAGIAFCAEILLRGFPTAGPLMGFRATGEGEVGHCHRSSRRPPPFVVLTDDACLARYFVQRRATGQEPFLSQAHVDDIQLFPRFRLNVLQHFERVAALCPMTVERICVAQAPAVGALHSLLCRILTEVVAELRAMERRLTECGSASVQSESLCDSRHNSGGLRLRESIAHCTQWGHKDGRSRVLAAPRFVRRPWLRGDNDECLSGIYFAGINDADAADVTDRSMDEDLLAALRAHTSTAWPFARLVESLLDVRGLLRALRWHSPFAFLFALDASLAQRMPRWSNRSLGYNRSGGSGAAPDAPWTLSGHFAAVVSLAVHRIGEVRDSQVDTVDVDTEATEATEATEDNGQGGMCRNRNKDLKENENEDDVVCMGPGRVLVPRRDEIDPMMECAARIVNAWGRDIIRRSHRRNKSNREQKEQKEEEEKEGEVVIVEEEDEKEKEKKQGGGGGGGREEHGRNGSLSPVLLLFVFGERALRRYVCRLTHSLEDFQTLELNGFIAAYQSRYGGDIRSRAEAPIAEPHHVAQLRSWFRAASDIHSDTNEELLSHTQSDSDANHLTDTASDGDSLKKSEAVGASLRGVLLSQPPLPLSVPNSVSISPPTAWWRLEAVGDGFAELSLSAARTFVVDGASLRAADLTALMAGTKQWGHSDEKRKGLLPLEQTHTTQPPCRVLIAGGPLRFLRLLEAAQDTLRLCASRNASMPRVQLLDAMPQQCPRGAESIANAEAAAEREAFEGLAHVKSGMTAALLANRDDIRETREHMDAGVARNPRRNIKPRNNSGSSRGSDAPLVVFDEREFRSLLPYALYRRGIELVPLTLATADYVLSPDHALERKSLPDFVQSLLSGRIHAQLAALSHRFAHPMCLIEADRAAPFRLTTSSTSAGAVPFFTRVARLVAAFPRVRWLWSRDPFHSASMVHEMKQTCAQARVDPSAPSLTRAAVAATDADDVAAAEKEAAHMAARVLSCFPGVTPANAQAVMGLCGSLAGLATIEEGPLAWVMGVEAARKLYTFLHGDLVESVE